MEQFFGNLTGSLIDLLVRMFATFFLAAGMAAIIRGEFDFVALLFLCGGLALMALPVRRSLLRRLEAEGPMSIGRLAQAFSLDTSTINRQTTAAGSGAWAEARRMLSMSAPSRRRLRGGRVADAVGVRVEQAGEVAGVAEPDRLLRDEVFGGEPLDERVHEVAARRLERDHAVVHQVDQHLGGGLGDVERGLRGETTAEHGQRRRHAAPLRGCAASKTSRTPGASWRVAAGPSAPSRPRSRRLATGRAYVRLTPKAAWSTRNLP
ncbi:hypothetical protein ACFU76_23175 [Streptomyces sp. NPDC057539]|uniref:hypothetical protein n=1 Tax=Streptomyces sp. NPDC057539 TaxID=3346159 RepID=UPI0036B7914F